MTHNLEWALKLNQIPSKYQVLSKYLMLCNDEASTTKIFDVLPCTMMMIMMISEKFCSRLSNEILNEIKGTTFLD